MARAARTALITGSGRNIGRGCALHLARAGFNVVVNGSSDRAACDRVAAEVRDAGVESMVSIADCSGMSSGGVTWILIVRCRSRWLICTGPFCTVTSATEPRVTSRPSGVAIGICSSR